MIRAIIVSVVGFILFVVCMPALGCMPGGISADDFLSLIIKSETDVVFVGSILSNDEKNVIFKVEKGFKNIKDGSKYSSIADQSRMQCMKLEPGQVWLYWHYPARHPTPAPPLTADQRSITIGGPQETEEQQQTAWTARWNSHFEERQSGVYLRDEFGEYPQMDYISMIKDKLGFDVLAADIPVMYGPSKSIYLALKRRQYEAKHGKSEPMNPFQRN